jgi:peroxiredoxin
MAQLRQDYEQFTAQGAEVLVVGPDDAQSFRYFWSRQSLPFVGLPDPEHQVANLYGQQVKLLKFGRMPALLIIDRAGQVRYRHYAESMSDIPENREVLAALEAVNERQSEIA